MAKRSQQKRGREKRRRQEKRKEKQVLSDADLKQVTVWKQRIETCVAEALDCYGRMANTKALTDIDLLRSLAKCVENTAESIKELDKLTHGQLFGLLAEIPTDSDEDGALTWKNLKGIRIPVAHQFWEIDYEIIVNAVRNDFPKLADLFSSLLIVEGVVEVDGASYVMKTADIPRPKVSADAGDTLKPGNSSILALYSRNLGWSLFRMFGDTDGTIHAVAFSREPDGRELEIKLYGR